MKRLCVYCGSSPGADPSYLEAAKTVGRILVEREIELVYGGGNVGLMGALADSVLAHSGKVTGVMPNFLVSKEVAHEGLTTMHVVATMHERKRLMAELSDAFVALPGGMGTLEELFEVLTWAQLGLHPKPCGLLNISGYFDHLIEFLRCTVQQRFVSQEHFAAVQVDTNLKRLLDRFERHAAPQSNKWLDRDKR